MRASVAFAVTSSLALPAQEPVDFARQVAPILVRHCIRCHGPKKDKGDLRLDRRELVFPEGDEDYWVVFAGEPDDSELIVRIELPATDEDMMPAEGEPLSAQQRSLLRRWVAEGAEWPAAGDEAIAKALAAETAPRVRFALPKLEGDARERIDRAVAALRAKGAYVRRVAADGEAIEANLSPLGGRVSDELLAELEPLAPRLVWLDLTGTAIDDRTARRLAGLTELRRLHLARTALGDRGVRALAGLSKLEFLNLFGTGVTDRGMQHLTGLAALRRVHVFGTHVTEAGRNLLKKHLPNVSVDL